MIQAKRIVEKVAKTLRMLPSYITGPSQTADELVIVTGADSTHCKSLHQLLSSLYMHEQDIKVVVFDLGLDESESRRIQGSFPRAELRLFDYSKYPQYFNIKINSGEYAWKPVIFSEILNEHRCCICWMDAGNVVTERLLSIRRISRKIGMYSPRSSGCIADWTHPKTLEFLDASDDLLGMHNLSGACVCVDGQNAIARDIVEKWKEYALIKECIAPMGSSRENHRQDQAVLSVLAHQAGITEEMPTERYGFKIHQDID